MSLLDRYGLLSHDELVELVASGVITNVEPDQINSASIDITLGSDLLIENVFETTVSLQRRDKIKMVSVSCANTDYLLEPGEFILAHSEQKFYLPNDISAEYKLKSSMARIGLEHLTAGWCDAGWNDSVLTLELKNMTQKTGIILNAGVRIGQMIFFRHTPVPDNRSYATRGRYNGDTTVTACKK